jgi:restriction endonuclease S subunit
MYLQPVSYTGAILSMDVIAKLTIPFPPLAEQRRIVTKVDQLVNLYDELETKLIKSQTKSEKAGRSNSEGNSGQLKHNQVFWLHCFAVNYRGLICFYQN